MTVESMGAVDSVEKRLSTFFGFGDIFPIQHPCWGQMQERN